jgi:hypothetical protein
MNPISLIGRGVSVATGTVRVATMVPRFALNLLVDQLKSEDPFAAAREVERDENGASAPPAAAGRAPGGTGRPGPSPAATPGRATDPDGSVQVTKGPAEPTSAAGASGGVGGTAAARGAAGASGAPDPTVPRVPQGQRRDRDVRPNGQPRRRDEAVADNERVVETEGAAAPGAQLRVEAPWDGYDAMKAGEIVARVRSADPAARAVVRLYEQTHKKRKSILDATAS